MEAAAELVVDAAGGHVAQGVVGDFQGRGVAGAVVVTQQEIERHWLRELGRVAPAAVVGIDGRDQALAGGVEQQMARLAGGVGLGRGGGEQDFGDAHRRVDHVLATGLIGLDQRVEDLPKRGQALLGGWREVGAAPERDASRRQEDTERPAALAGEGDNRLHVDAVDVGAFLAVDLDGDEVPVEDRGDRRVLEGLVGHDVAPVAGRVADAQEDGLVFGAGALESGVAPGVPVDRIVDVLLQVRAGFGGELVGQKVVSPVIDASTGAKDTAIGPAGCNGRRWRGVGFAATRGGARETRAREPP